MLLYVSLATMTTACQSRLRRVVLSEIHCCMSLWFSRFYNV